MVRLQSFSLFGQPFEPISTVSESIQFGPEWRCTKVSKWKLLSLKATDLEPHL